MSLSLPPLLASTTPQTAALIGNATERSGKTNLPAISTATPTPTPEEQIGARAPTSEAVNLSPANDAILAAQRASMTYAEIWRDGRKIAEVDSTGEISSFEGTVSAPPGGGSGIALAAQRAVMIARSLGGEIRVGGLPTDPATLTMQNRLRATYGV